MPLSKIKNKKELRKGLNNLFKGISIYCKNCKYIDCRGYIWLHPKEVKEISKRVDTIKINDEITFIDSFIREKGKINTEIPQPKCKLKNNCEKCSIQNIKPLVCMLYPLNLRKIDNKIYLVLNEDCLFVDNLKKEKKLNEFKKRTILLWNKLDKKFLKEFLDIFNKVELISCYPNDYHKEIIKILKII